MHSRHNDPLAKCDELSYSQAAPIPLVGEGETETSAASITYGSISTKRPLSAAAEPLAKPPIRAEYLPGVYALKDMRRRKKKPLYHA